MDKLLETPPIVLALIVILTLAVAVAEVLRRKNAKGTRARSEDSIQSELDHRIIMHDIRNHLGSIAFRAAQAMSEEGLSPDTAGALTDISIKVEVIKTLTERLRYRG